MEDLFGCELDAALLNSDISLLGQVRIVGPAGKFYYAEPQDDESPAEQKKELIDQSKPLIVEEAITSLLDNSILVEWMTEYSHTALYDDFTVQAKNSKGDYETVNCSRYMYEKPADGLFGCELDPSYLRANGYSLNHLRIKISNGAYVYTVPSDEDFHPLIIEDPIVTVQGSKILVEWATHWDYTA